MVAIVYNSTRLFVVLSAETPNYVTGCEKNMVKIMVIWWYIRYRVEFFSYLVERTNGSLNTCVDDIPYEMDFALGMKFSFRRIGVMCVYFIR